MPSALENTGENPYTIDDVESGQTTRISFLTKLRENPTQSQWQSFDARYRELLYRYALRKGASHAEAEDVAQEVQMSFFKAMNGFRYDRGKGRFRAYLRASVVHALVRRTNGKKELALSPEVLTAIVDSDSDADPTWDREWELHRLRCAMDEIAADFEHATLTAFRLHVLSDWSAEQTAQHLGISVASVYQAKCRVLKRLKEKVQETTDDFD